MTAGFSKIEECSCGTKLDCTPLDSFAAVDDDTCSGRMLRT